MKRTRPGRPRIDDGDDVCRLNLTLSAYQYDYLYAGAQRAGVSVPEMLRRRLRLPTNKRDKNPRS